MRWTAFKGVLLALSVAACSGPAPGPEREIRDWVERGESFVAEEDRRGLVGMISADYTDARGNRREDIDELFRLVFFRTDAVTLVTHVEEIKIIDGSAAELKLNVGMAGRDDFGVFGFNADAYEFELELVNEGNDWQLIAARWGEIGGQMR